MICELQIKLGKGKVPLLYHSNHFVYEIERVCDSQNRFKLFEAYNKAFIFPTKHKGTVDSELTRKKDKADLREELTQKIPYLTIVLQADCMSFDGHLRKLEENLNDNFA